MNKPLKQSVRDHFELHNLSEDQLSQLKSLARQKTAVSRQRVSVYPMILAGALAAFLLAFLLTPHLLDDSNIAERVAMEVVNNHLKLKPLEIETGSMNDIRTYFNKLDFVPANSKLVNRFGLELLGGRYCSLQGVAAAQLRVKQAGSERVQTLYQTEYKKDVFDDMPALEDGDEPVSIFVKGVKVKIWVEKGLLFALTDIPEN